ncbi:MAG: dihydrofolate reductase family protein [Gemmatimonadaceae bacterium]
MPRAAKKAPAKKKKTTKKAATPRRSGRRVIYSVAMSLDGYIAGPKGEYDWIVMDPDIDFNAMGSPFDTLLIGRRTFAPVAAAGQGGGGWPGMKSIVFSRTLKQSDYPDVTIVSDDAVSAVKELKAQPGKDMWLFGGGDLFRSLLDAGLVDGVGVAVMPVVLGGGVPFLPAPAKHTKLKLVKHKLYPKTGTLSLEYDVV